MLNVGDEVTLTDKRGESRGTVKKLLPTPGMASVEWDSGVTEQVHESELTKADGAPSQQPVKNTETLHHTVAAVVSEDEHAEFMKAIEPQILTPIVKDDNIDTGYEQDDPKHPTFRERLSALWDSVSGK